MTGYVPRDLESWQRRALRVQLARVTQVLADTVVWTAGMLASSLTRQIDLAVAALGAVDDSAADAVAVGRRVLADDSGEW